MSTTKTFAGASYNLPLNREPKSSSWGTEVSNFLLSLADNAIPKTGGSYTLSAELNLGATYGVLAPYIKSAGTNIATAGVVRLSKTETVGWRNNANDADLALGIDTSNRLTFNGVVLATAGAASIVNADINASAAIAYSKLAALTAGSVLLGSASNVATVTALSGDVTVNSSGVTAIGATKVTNGMLAGSIAYSKLSLSGAILNADLAGSIAYSKLSLTGAILNADLAGSIAYSKLSLTGAVLNADLAGSIAYSKLSLTGAILNADLAGSIAYSKLSLTGAILNADLAGSIAYSKLSLGTSIVNGDISTSAAIAYSKLNLAASVATADLASGLLVPLTKGGTGQTTANAALNALLPSQGSASGKVLSSNGTDTSWASAASSTLSQYNTDIGDSSNARQATNTNLVGDAVGTYKTSTVTMTIATPGVVTWTGHGLATYDKVYFTTSAASLPTGVSASTTYYITVVSTDTFKLSTSFANAVAGTFVATSGSQSGTHTGFAGGLAIASATSTTRGLMLPVTAMSDALATSMGLKQYYAGTTYNGSVNPTVTNNKTSPATTRAVYVPYQVQDGTWRLKFNLSTTFTGNPTVTSVKMTITGVTFKNVAGAYQPVAGMLVAGGLGSVQQCWADPNTGDVYVGYTSTTSTTTVCASGDVELDSKPTWAY